jgi:predicted AlkP superfamily phosphohydrolase/phosphomutase
MLRGRGRIEYDLERSACFPVENGAQVGAVRLNLRGREPSGRLRPGAEAEAFLASLTRDLHALVDERTGGPLVERVHRMDDLYPGPRRDHLPDLLIEWASSPPTGSTCHGGGAGAEIRATSPRTGPLRWTNHYVRTGDHRRDGFFVLAGPGVPPGRRSAPLSVLDLHPLVCGLLDVPCPEVDGVVPVDLLPSAAGSGG